MKKTNDAKPGFWKSFEKFLKNSEAIVWNRWQNSSSKRIQQKVKVPYPQTGSLFQLVSKQALLERIQDTQPTIKLSL